MQSLIESVIDVKYHATGAANQVNDVRGIERLLKTMRRYLKMDVAFVSQFHTGYRVLVHVDSSEHTNLRRHQKIPSWDGYCHKVISGEFPEYAPDTAYFPKKSNIPSMHKLPIGAYLCVPIKLEDGHIYGTLSCFSSSPNPLLDERDMQLMRAISEILAVRLDEEVASERMRKVAAADVRHAILQGAPRIVFQPIFDVAQASVRGFECLSRFDLDPRRPPDQWFAAANTAGLGLDLELHAIRKSLADLKQFPPQCTLSVNSSPELILSDKLQVLLSEEYDLSRVVIEVTEHAVVRDYIALTKSLAPFRQKGAKLAVDDAGAGYSSMRHILNLAPEIIKLDISIIQGIDSDSKRRALAKGLISFSHEIGSLVIAEGVERMEELDSLFQLDVDCAQGYLLSKPLDFDMAIALVSGL